jgi:hypothetical protein
VAGPQALKTKLTAEEMCAVLHAPFFRLLISFFGRFV